VFARVLILVALVAVVWSVTARPSGAHGDRVVYRVQPYDTLWTIASAHYGGDVRDAVWRIERANRLRDATVRPGQRLVLP
jgi:nucleoid-associated protein YgaU